MNDQKQMEQAAAPKRRGRGCLTWLGGLLAVVLVLALIGAMYQSVAEAADAKKYPPPGQLVDVGGHRLHLLRPGRQWPAREDMAGAPGLGIVPRGRQTLSSEQACYSAAAALRVPASAARL